MFDSEFKNYFHIDLKMEYQKTKLYILFGLFLTNFLIILFVVVIIKDSEELLNLERFGEFTAYIIPTVLNAFVCFQFCTLVMCLRQRFRWLNEQIWKFESDALAVNKNNLLLSKNNIKEQRLLP